MRRPRGPGFTLKREIRGRRKALVGQLVQALSQLTRWPRLGEQGFPRPFFSLTQFQIAQGVPTAHTLDQSGLLTQFEQLTRGTNSCPESNLKLSGPKGWSGLVLHHTHSDSISSDFLTTLDAADSTHIETN